MGYDSIKISGDMVAEGSATNNSARFTVAESSATHISAGFKESEGSATHIPVGFMVAEGSATNFPPGFKVAEGSATNFPPGFKVAEGSATNFPPGFKVAEGSASVIPIRKKRKKLYEEANRRGVAEAMPFFVSKFSGFSPSNKENTTMRKQLNKITLPLLAMAALAFTFLGCSSDGEEETEQPAAAGGNTFIDARDNKTYKWVLIGDQVWMAEDMRYESANSKCAGDNPANCANGRVYTWPAAMAACPAEYHLPSMEEWNVLLRFVDHAANDGEEFYDSPTAGRYLKADHGWYEDSNGEDTYGFAALPAGLQDSGDDYQATWWTSTPDDGWYYVRRIYSFKESDTGVGYYEHGADDYLKARCIHD